MSTRPPARPGSARAALSSAHFRRMWAASFTSNIGTWMQNVVLPLYVLDRTDSAFMVGVMVFAQLGPHLVLSIPAGVIADRFDRRRWLVATQIAQLVCSLLLAPLAAADAPIGWIFITALGVGIGGALNAPAWSAMLPALVRRADLSGAVSMNTFNINGSRVIAPVLVAILRTSGVGIAQIFVINAATYLVVVAALLRTPVPRPQPVTEAGVWRQLTAGFRIVRANPVLSRLLISLFTFSLLSLPYVGLFPAVARRNFGIEKDSTLYEWLYGVWGLGAALGGLAVGTVFVGLDMRRLVRRGFAAFAVCLALFALAREPIGAFASGIFLGAAYFGTTTAMNTILQSRLADHERGRVMSLWFMAFGGTVPIGNLVFGPVMDAIGARWVLIVGAATAGILAMWCDIEGLDARSGQQAGDHPLETRHPTPLDEHGLTAGE